MAQSLNKTVELHTTGVSYMAIGGKVGKFLIGDVALEFYPDVNVEQPVPKKEFKPSLKLVKDFLKHLQK